MPNPINKVVFGGTTIIDLSSDTITAADLTRGKTAHDKSGNAIVGTNDGGGGGATPYTLSINLDNCTRTGAFTFAKNFPSGSFTAAKAAYDSGARVDVDVSSTTALPGYSFVNGCTTVGSSATWIQWYNVYQLSAYGDTIICVISITLTYDDTVSIILVPTKANGVLDFTDLTPVSESEYVGQFLAGAFSIAKSVYDIGYKPTCEFVNGSSQMAVCVFTRYANDLEAQKYYFEGDFTAEREQGVYVSCRIRCYSDDTAHVYIDKMLYENPSGGGNEMIVTYTISDENTITCDTEYSDIMSAMANGGVVVAKVVVDSSLANGNFNHYAGKTLHSCEGTLIGESQTPTLEWTIRSGDVRINEKLSITHWVNDGVDEYSFGWVGEPLSFTVQYNISTDMQGNYTVTNYQSSYSGIYTNTERGCMPIIFATLAWNGQTIATAEGYSIGMNGPATNSPIQAVLNFTPSGSPMPMKILLSHDNQDNVTVTAIT